MPTKTWFGDGGGTSREADILWVGVAGAPRQVTKAWVGVAGDVPKLAYVVPKVTIITASRDACVDNSGHIIGWTVQGTTTGWTIKLERQIAGAGWTTISSTLDPVTANPTTVAYASGNSRTETDFRVSLIRGSHVALGSPVTKLAPITPC